MLCYGFAGNAITFAGVRVLQGFSDAFLGVAIPAIFGITLKKETMGFAFAIYSAMDAFCTNFGRPIGLSVYGALGQKTLGITIAVLALCILALSMFLDFNQIEKELQTVRDRKKQNGKKKSVLDGLMVKAVPIAIPIAIPMLAWTADGIYFPSYADSLGINPTLMLYAAGLIASAMFGCSHLGATQMEALRANPPHLKAVFVGMTDFNKYDGWVRGGIPRETDCPDGWKRLRKILSAPEEIPLMSSHEIEKDAEWMESIAVNCPNGEKLLKEAICQH